MSAAPSSWWESLVCTCQADDEAVATATPTSPPPTDANPAPPDAAPPQAADAAGEPPENDGTAWV